ncbi:MAG: hypothetical protein RIC14_05030 [Filomicrobium sp.]
MSAIYLETSHLELTIFIPVENGQNSAKMAEKLASNSAQYISKEVNR